MADLLFLFSLNERQYMSEKQLQKRCNILKSSLRIAGITYRIMMLIGLGSIFILCFYKNMSLVPLVSISVVYSSLNTCGYYACKNSLEEMYSETMTLLKEKAESKAQ